MLSPNDIQCVPILKLKDGGFTNPFIHTRTHRAFHPKLLLRLRKSGDDESFEKQVCVRERERINESDIM